MIVSHLTSSARPQQQPSDRGAQFRALASGPGSALPQAGNSTESQIIRARSNQPGCDASEDDLSLPEAGHMHLPDDSPSLSSGGAGGALVSSLLANLLVESARKSNPVAEHWKLIVPLENVRFPDSAVLIYSGPESISVQFRSCHGAVVSMLGPIVDTVGLMAHQSLGRSVQCDVCQVATLAELYQ